MAKETKRVDIGGNPHLVRLVEQARATNEPVVLRRDDEDVAVLRALKRLIPRGRPISADDPLWKLVGIGVSEGHGDVSTDKHKYLAEDYADLHANDSL